MGNYAEPFTDFTLLNDGYFKFSNGHKSVWSLEDVKYLKHHLEKGNVSPYELEKQSHLTFFTISRIIATLKNGGFDEFISDNIIEDVDLSENGAVHIYDGVHIEINNYYTSKSEEKPKKKPNGNINAWSKRVRQRDGYTCAVCGKQDMQHMEAHHIEPKSIKPERATDDLNGVAICQRCHKRYNERYAPKNQNMVTFSRFIFEENRGY